MMTWTYSVLNRHVCVAVRVCVCVLKDVYNNATARGANYAEYFDAQMSQA